MNIFAQATKEKLRFESSKGNLSVEDLWELPLQSQTGKPNLDDIYKSVKRELDKDQEESYVNKATSSPINDLRLEVVKSVIDTKMQENEAAKNAVQIKQRKEYLRNLLHEKQNEKDSKMSEAQIKKELDNLE